MGGVVTRAFILKYQQRVAKKVRFLFFFATPTSGSPYATIAGIVSSTPQFGNIYPMNPDNYLAEQQKNWLAARLGLRSFCAYEVQPLVLGQIVIEQSSAACLLY
jgi:hypothetical protein